MLFKSLIQIAQPRAWEKAQWRKCLLCRSEDLSSDPQRPAGLLCDPSAPTARRGRARRASGRLQASEPGTRSSKQQESLVLACWRVTPTSAHSLYTEKASENERASSPVTFSLFRAGQPPTQPIQNSSSPERTAHGCSGHPRPPPPPPLPTPRQPLAFPL